MVSWLVASQPRPGTRHGEMTEEKMSTEVRVGPLSDFPDGGLTGLEADGHPLIVARKGDEVCVARNRCPHLGFSLTSGPGGLKYENGVVQCPWHNSRFNVCSGENLDWVTGFAGRRVPGWSRPLIALGRRPRGLDTLSATVRDGDVYVTV
jgi:nitrite reductase/ring-hydroxylating ferredoxin subunit